MEIFAAKQEFKMQKLTLFVTAITCLAVLTAGGIAWRIQSISQKPTDRIGLPADLLESTEVPRSSAQLAEIRPQVDAFCGGCHAKPSPASFPRDAWYEEVQRGYNFYFASSRQDLTPPPLQEVIEYFRSQASPTLEIPYPPADPSAKPGIFEHQSIPLPPGKSIPAVSYITTYSPLKDGHEVALFCDMGTGEVGRIRFENDQKTVETFAVLAHPAHIEPVDFDHNGEDEFLVAEMGSREPADHDKGKVVWLKPAGPNRYEPIILCEGIGRVADVEAADFDRDGDLDLIVAEFGWHTTGRILLLNQVDIRDGIPQFERQLLDKRHGCIHVPITDLNGDGAPDFVALISQEHEVIDAFINRGDGSFEIHPLYSAGDPSYGSSGIQLVDLDTDGDLDILYTNGDTLDSYFLKPYHSVQWLENLGSYRFEHRSIASLPGVYRAIARDLDGDGDLDIAACAMIPDSLRNLGADASKLDAVIWLEQTKPGHFERHPLQHLDAGGSLALHVGDYDGDGRVDLLVGRFASAFVPGGYKEWFAFLRNIRPQP